MCLVFTQDVNVLRMTSLSRYNENMRNGFNKEGLREVSGGAEEGLGLHLHTERAAEGFSRGPVVGSPPANAGDTGSAPGPGIPHVPQGSSTRAPQLLKPTHLEPMLCNKRSPCNEKPAHGKEEQLPPRPRPPPQPEKACSSEDPVPRKKKTAENTRRTHHCSHRGICVAGLSMFS